MDLRDLRAFMHVAQLKSFSRAAAQLRIAQSAVSRRVLRLEHEVGVTLLERHSRGIRLTEFGTLLCKRAEDVFRTLRQVETEMMAISNEPSGHIRIAFPPATGQVLAPILIETFGERYPRVSLQVKEGFTSNIQDWLINGVVDLAMLYNPEPSPDVFAVPLLTEPLFLISANTDQHPSADWGNAKQIPLQEVFNLPLILPGRSHSIRLLMDRTGAGYGISPNITLEVDGMNIIKRLVERGLGYTVFNYAGVSEEVERGSLRAIPICKPTFTWQLALAGRNDGLASGALADLRHLIETEVRRLIDQGFYDGKKPAADSRLRVAS
jgi:LysR family nitrogen assimilation transcriptional regulator